MAWSDYMEMAAKHSKNSAQHWFRYLRKDIGKCGVSFSKQEVEKLYNDEKLTPFQRVSIKAAFNEGSETQKHIVSLNNKANLNMISSIKEKYGKINSP